MKPLSLAVVFAASVALISPLHATNRAPAVSPPGGLTVAEVPQFVMLGFDDNPDVAPMRWIVDFMADQRNPVGQGRAATFDGAPARVAFYSNGIYFADTPGLPEIHVRAFAEGHEIGNHTQHHHHGGTFTEAQWREEMELCREVLAGAGIPRAAMIGFRTPFLEYNAATFAALAATGFTYDSTIEEGDPPDQDGTNFLWPYTLDTGSPGNALHVASEYREQIAPQPGVWEIPLHVFMLPADADCARYGVKSGLRQRAHDNILRDAGWEWSMEAGKITGLDWNVLEMAHLDGPDFLAILKYTLDLRLAGNRAPFMVGGHTALYPTDKPDRRAAIEAFVTYALSKPEVRLVTPTQVLAWLRKPVALAH
ncbi:polysaccharide deacetylase family protein [Synoicihabitans lomoniglobus]|uniref:Polysaccharide deacetylase family protein n=1 Tax=Synoicihabitans lomoniglobus TaxID=2909285 RepID=A0AAF0CPG2_9BACT|nr:polysaccharide deacetylase family protein [Opitutaceae bacterium LMO-M01]WED64579.1 polysaccharide deacetylase family protein [Opitutaceae bacterium LMO-M01]